MMSNISDLNEKVFLSVVLLVAEISKATYAWDSILGFLNIIR